MCLGVPGKVIEIYQNNGIRMGKVDFGGLTKEVCLAYVPEIAVGDYTIVHVGFAITQLDEASAQESLALIREMGPLEIELGGASEGSGLGE
ncbi:MAG TPA: HypC/HybG/HupF family hydrogenase formation chaperone [Caldilineaceae bacterium]|nr:HypC/HybG/HupF family hydrogenase formation chaperone [Caldilineaceae bacterium]